MSSALTRQEQPMANAIEQVVIAGDLKTLTSAQRVDYYNRVCESVGLNPYTRPFEYITLNGKLTLYARRDAADQLRAIHGISLSKPHIEYVDDMVVVTIEASDRYGRTDADLGAVSIKGLQGEARANAMLKAITKAKRRVTLSLAGLGWLDETEIDSIPTAQRVTVDAATGEIVNGDVLFEARELASQEQVKALDTLGESFYGQEWVARRVELSHAISNKRTETPDELTPKEVARLIAGIEKKMDDIRKAEAA